MSSGMRDGLGEEPDWLLVMSCLAAELVSL
jgi:hypothetical protein